MLAQIAQWSVTDPSGNVWNASNSLIVPNYVWNNMNMQFYAVMASVVVLGIILAIGGVMVMFTPAWDFIQLRVKGGVGVLSFMRTGRWKVIPVKDKGGFLISKDEIHQTLPGSMAINKGCLVGVSWDESGTCVPPAHAAAMGMIYRMGIPDAETMELFNFYLMSTDEFNRLVDILTVPYDPNPPATNDPDRDAKILKQMAYQKAYFLELLPSAEPGAGSFGSLLQHAKEAYAIPSEQGILDKFREISDRIPRADTVEDFKKKKLSRFPYWWNTVRGLVCNVSGQMLSWVEIKNLQIYHQHPRALDNVVQDESDRKARKMKKDNSMMLMVMVIGIAAFAMIAIMAYKFM